MCGVWDCSRTAAFSAARTTAQCAYGPNAGIEREIFLLCSESLFRYRCFSAKHNNHMYSILYVCTNVCIFIHVLIMYIVLYVHISCRRCMEKYFLKKLFGKYSFLYNMITCVLKLLCLPSRMDCS